MQKKSKRSRTADQAGMQQDFIDMDSKDPLDLFRLVQANGIPLSATQEFARTRVLMDMLLYAGQFASTLDFKNFLWQAELMQQLLVTCINMFAV
eukprot:1123210-Karenia_brevis.AAC.1